jgi:hypothetical protein
LCLQFLPIQLAYDVTPPLAQLFDSSAGARDVKELPLWLVKGLVTMAFGKTATPKIYSKKTLAKLKASASHQLLHHLSPYYYEVGCEVSELLGDAEINIAITAAYVQRYKDILDRFGHIEDKSAGKFKGCLTLFEQRCKSNDLSDFFSHQIRRYRILNVPLQYSTWATSWRTIPERGAHANWRQSVHPILLMSASGQGLNFDLLAILVFDHCVIRGYYQDL